MRVLWGIGLLLLPLPALAAQSITLVMQPTIAPEQQAVMVALNKSRSLHIVVETLNSVLALPQPLNISFNECPAADVAFDAKTGDLRFCYGSIAAAAEATKAPPTSIALFTLLHSMAHALSQTLELGLGTAISEETLDELAMVLMMSSEEALDTQTLQGMGGFTLAASQAPPASAHPMTAARSEKFNCMLYGSDPKRLSGLVGTDALPKEKATRCSETLNAMLDNWSHLLGSYVKETQ
jgi:hypothetical protein